MTKKSHSFVKGSILAGDAKNCEERKDSLADVVFKAAFVTRLVRRAKVLIKRG
jgi:hypothetical protein